jgi:hypothetical protein
VTLDALADALVAGRAAIANAGAAAHFLERPQSERDNGLDKIRFRHPQAAAEEFLIGERGTAEGWSGFRHCR